MAKLLLTPLSPVLGAEVRGVNLAEGVDEAVYEEIHRAWLRYGVLFFKEQPAPMSESVQTSFARRFGELHVHPAAPGTGKLNAVFVIHCHRDSKVANGNGWHSDVSCEPTPPMATMLQLRKLPSSGGDTLFASMEAAYAVLSREERSFLQGLSALHSSEHIYRGRYAERGVDDADKSYPKAVHPVVRTHPETGRPSLYINRAFTTALVGVERSEGDRLLGRLLRHVERPEFQIRFRWERYDTALWDNRCLQHYALWDYWPEERLGHRVTVAGEVPFFDSLAPEPPASPIRLATPRLRPA